MRRIAAFITMAALYGGRSFGALLAYEGFDILSDYANGATIVSTSPSVLGFSNSWTRALTGTFLGTTNGLEYAGLMTTKGAVRSPAALNVYLHRELSGVISNDTYWVSFLFHQGVNDSAVTSGLILQESAGTTDADSILIGNKNGSFSVLPGNGTSADRAIITNSDAELHLFVAKLEMTGSGTEVSVWMDPDATATNEAALGTAGATKNFPTLMSINALSMARGSLESGDLTIDELRIATTLDEALHAVPEIPVSSGATLIAYEGFDVPGDYTNGATIINTAPPVIGFTGSWSNTLTGEFLASASGLSYPGLATTAGSVWSPALGQPTANVSLHRKLASALSDGTYWVSFLFRTMVNDAAVGTGLILQQRAGVSDADSILIGNKNGQFSVLPGNGVNTDRAIIQTSDNQRHLFVAKLEITGSGTDVSVWMDPDATLTNEVLLGTAGATKNFPTLTAIEALAMARLSLDSGDFYMDELRIAATLDDALHAVAKPSFFEVSIAVQGADAVIGWEGVAGVTYALQSKPNLLFGAWSNVVENVSGNGMLFITNATGLSSKFYRVVGE